MQYIQDLFQRIVQGITNFFSPAGKEFALERVPFSVPEREAKKKRAPRKPKANEAEDDGSMPKETLAELLEHLDLTFDTMKLKTDHGSWLDKDTVTGLRRMGVYVPHPWAIYYTDPDKLRVDVTRKFPTLMAVSLCVDHEQRRDDDLVSANTMFAIKHERLPWNVSPMPGIAYQFGVSYKFASNHNFWMRCYLVVDPKTGEISFCDELCNQTQRIPVKHGRKSNGSETSYVSRRWGKPALINTAETKDGTTIVRTAEERKAMMMNLFASMHEWWADRDQRWSVAVRQGKDRVIFSVEPENTKTYFADRDKSVKAADGKAKKIIHYVRPHDRIRDGKTISVREHIRGIREFDWGKYHCIVTAPTFHRTRLSSDFDLASMCEDDTEEATVRTVSASQLGAELARIEEMDLRTRK